MSVEAQLEPLVSSCCKLMVRSKEKVNPEEVIDLMKRVDLVLDHPETDFQYDDVFNIFAALMVLLCGYLHFIEQDSQIEGRRYLFKLCAAACYVVRGDWEKGYGVFLLDPKVQERESINQLTENWILYCKHRDLLNQHYEKIVRKIKSARNTYYVSLNELVQTLDEACDLHRKKREYRMFSALCKKFELQVIALTRTFINFYRREFTSMACIEVEETVKSNIRKMLGVIINCPVYAYIFPVYMFLMFVKEPNSIHPALKCSTNHPSRIFNCEEDSSEDGECKDIEKAENAFYTKLSLPKNMKSKVLLNRYVALMNEIKADIFNPSIPIEMENLNDQVSRAVIHNQINYPLLFFKDIYDAIASFVDEEIPDEQLEQLSDMFDRVVGGSGQSRKGELGKKKQRLLDTPEKKTLWKYIEKIVDIFSEYTYIYLSLGELPATARINKIKEIYQLLFPKREMYLESQKEKKVLQLLKYCDEIAAAVHVRWVDMNMITHQNLIGYNNQFVSDYDESYEGSMEWMFDELQKGFEKQRLVFMRRVPGEYRIDRETRVLALFIRTRIINPIPQKKLSLGDYIDFFNRQIIWEDKFEETIEYIKHFMDEEGKMKLRSYTHLVNRYPRLMMWEPGDAVEALDCLREDYIKWCVEDIIWRMEDHKKKGTEIRKILEYAQTLLDASDDDFLIQKEYLYSNVFLEFYLGFLQMMRCKMIHIIGID